MIRRPLLLAFATSLAATNLASASGVILGPGQTGLLGASKITVLKATDSRCPQEVQCIQAGELTVKLLLSQGSKSRLLYLRFPELKNTPWLGVRIVSASPKTLKSTPLKITFADTPK